MSERYRKSAALLELERLADAAAMERYKIPPEWLARRKYDDRTANHLTRAIIDYIRLNQGQAERVANMGRPVDHRQTFTDVVGRTRTVGSVTWIPGRGTNGTADIHAVIAGKAVMIEIKHGADRQSDAQRRYQQAIVQAGGTYLVIRDFEQFINWHKSYINEQR